MANKNTQNPRKNTSLRGWLESLTFIPFYDSYKWMRIQQALLEAVRNKTNDPTITMGVAFSFYQLLKERHDELKNSQNETERDRKTEFEQLNEAIRNSLSSEFLQYSPNKSVPSLSATVHNFLKRLANPFWNITWINDTQWGRLPRMLTAPVFASLALPLELWRTLHFLVACVATPLLWAGQHMMNALLDVFKPLPDEGGSDEQPRNPGPDGPTPAVLHSRSASPEPEAPSSQNRAATPSPN